MRETLGPFYITDGRGNLVWKGDLKEFVFEDEHGQRWRGKIEPNERQTIPAKVRKRSALRGK